MIVVGISGALQAGKDCVASRLTEKFGFTRVGFADALKDEVKTRLRRTLVEMTDLWWNAVSVAGWPGDKAAVDYAMKAKPPWMRALLQEYGSEVRRADNTDYWIKAWWSQFHGELIGVPHSDRRVVVPDVRFENEAQYIKWRIPLLYGHNVSRLLKVERPGHIVTDSHASEHGLDTWTEWDAVFVNDGTLGELWEKVDTWAFALQL